MNMRGNNLVRGISLKEGLLEEITIFVIHDLDIGLCLEVVSFSRVLNTLCWCMHLIWMGGILLK